MLSNGALLERRTNKPSPSSSASTLLAARARPLGWLRRVLDPVLLTYFYQDGDSEFEEAHRLLVERRKWRLVDCQERPYLSKVGVEALYFLYQTVT